MEERLKSAAATLLCFSARLQDDVVMGTLTVRENLNFSAALRLPNSIRQDDKEQMVDKLIQELGLGRVANSKVRTEIHTSICANTGVEYATHKVLTLHIKYVSVPQH